MLHPNNPGWLISIYHDGSEGYVSNPYPQIGEVVRLKLRTGLTSPVKNVFLRTSPDGEATLARMQKQQGSPGCNWWIGDLPVTEPVTHYRFLIDAEDGIWNYSAIGICAHEPLDAFDFQILAGYQPVSWLAGTVFYQIFPDRFANGDSSNDPQPDEYEFRGNRPRTYPWGEAADPKQIMPLVFYGGDLQGIIQHLDYLQQLGVNALYINPIFSAFSNHKYDVVDYDHVDAHLGGDQSLVNLRQALDQRGMRYILDIVPNHSGYWHSWFQKARQDKNSTEAEFYTFRSHPEEYASWLGEWMLPKLNYQSMELRRRMYAGSDSVFRHWLLPPYSADGWRVDVANMLARQGVDQYGVEIARGIRQAVKQTNPDAYLFGEHFFDATSQLQGDQWDGVMNYVGMSVPLLRWLQPYRIDIHRVKGVLTSDEPLPTSALEATWLERRAAIPWVIAQQQYNLLGSHDTERIQSVVKGNTALHRLAALVQFTYPGVPGIYYGDEIGMQDEPMLAQRGCMRWNENQWDHHLLDYYCQLIAFRRNSSVLQRGGFQMLVVEQDLFAFQREHDQGRVIVIANRSASPRPAGSLSVVHGGIPDGSFFVELFTGQDARVKKGALWVPELPQGGTLWEQKLE